MNFLKNLLPYVLIVLVVVLIRSFIVTPVRVSGSSMYPTLKNNEILILNKLAKFDRFDIVVLHKIEESDDDLIKRIIALPGETIEIKNNQIYVNDKLQEDEFGNGVTYNIDKMVLGEDEYFVLGDNRQISLDSRFFGPFKRSSIKGVANFVIYPFKSFGKVK